MNRDGFTLAETLVALVLFAAAAVVFCQTVLHARMALQGVDIHEPVHSHVRWIHHDVLRILDRGQLEEGGEIELAPRVRRTAAGEPDAEPERTSARWSAEVRPTAVLDVHEVTLTVEFLHGGATEEEIEIHYYVFRPDWYEADAREALLLEKREYWERLSADRR